MRRRRRANEAAAGAAGEAGAVGAGVATGAAAELAGAVARRRRARRAFVAALLVALAALAVFALGVGAVRIPPGAVLRCLGGWLPQSWGLAGPPPDPAQAAIIIGLRLPRIIVGAIVGAALGATGAVLQALLRNPMADPYVIGASWGASLGAVAAMVSGVSVRLLGLSAVPLCAFAGALVAMLLVYRVAREDGALPTLTLLLAGIAVGSLLSAGVSMLVYFADRRLHQVVFWLMGGLGGATWSHVLVGLPYLALGLGAAMFYCRDLNAMLMGEETARQLGVEVERAKRVLLAASALLTAVAVALAGPIGFVGLVVPHMVRPVAGADHRYLLPAAALGGATLLVAADTLARTVIAPTELPVGLVTALLGSPFFIYILRSRRRMRFFAGRGG